jgi:very-short-patch-repair endonuclease
LKTIGIVWPTKNHEKIKSDIKSKYKNILTISSELNDVILPSLEMAFLKQKINQFETSISSSIKYLKNSKYNNKIAKSLLETLKSIDFIKYEVFFAELLVLSNKVPEYTRLLALITKLEVGSPFFSKNIITRQVDSLISKINNFSVSWKISFLDYTIEERNKISPTELQDVLKEKQAQLKMINKDLIFCLVEKNQIERTGPEQRQALRGWVQTQNKITKQGTGVLDDFRRKESRNLLRKCKSAVPVWIMPLKRVLDNFNLVDDSFDVLIIDEASQADLTNLPVFSIAKKVIVVGDDKQVSPSGAGVKLVGLESLIDEFLKEIPNKQNYDFKFSLYDVACSSFGDTVRLSEHFRCVPEIIQFCNDLSYNGMIKVLRESKNNPIPKATVAHYVDGQNEDDINKAEAETITSLILCMKDRPEYANKSFGVISLKGQFQHQYIDQLLRLNLTSKEYEDLKIICGKAPQFQGDERDVIFLSLVESPKSEGPLTLQSDTDERKKEYNVAVSRARNKLWVLHSMNPHTHLKPEDLRLRLLKHVENPISLVEKYSEQAKMAESPFEKSVHEDLARAGYKFIPQYKIGAYRIDIVLFASDGTRIAIECDGDKFHSGEEKIREDLQRQSVLERMNVKFIRVRGSDYYRKREKTLNNIFQKLKLYNVLIDFSSDVVSIDTNLKTQEIISEAEKIRLNLLGVEFDTTDLNFKKRSMKV